jgi:hypothetical protein
MTSLLKDHPIWQNLDQTLTQIDSHQIATQHLQSCGMQIDGYWDEDNFYELISFTHPLQPQLISSSLGMSPSERDGTRWLQLKFLLNAKPSDDLMMVNHDDSSVAVGDLVLILNESLEVIDENWLIDMRSPYVIAVPG